MNEFDFESIINYLEDILFEDIDDLAKVDDDYNVDLSGMDQCIKQHTIKILKAVEYDSRLKKEGKTCITCSYLMGNQPGKCICSDCKIVANKITKTGEMCNWKPLLTIEDFK